MTIGYNNEAVLLEGHRFCLLILQKEGCAMLLFEDKYIKALGSALAIGLMVVSLMMAISAAQMPPDTLSMAQSLEEDKEKAKVAQGTDIRPSSPKTADRSQTRERQVEEPKARAPVFEANSGGMPGPSKTNGTGTQAQAALPERRSSGLSEGDIWLMAQLIHAEGRGESLEGQVAIGAVLLNRTRDSRFPSSLAGVIYESGAFCTVRDGQINLSPDSNALRAARLAASGWDPSGGALYFYNPARSTSRWIYTRPVINRIGHHVFAL
jgi:spore germination cell wall hydrolase CwlJ-like protein